LWQGWSRPGPLGSPQQIIEGRPRRLIALLGLAMFATKLAETMAALLDCAAQ
jgi:hypothetical protein